MEDLPLPDEGVPRNAALEQIYRFGGCYGMAYALARRLGWRAEALVADMRERRGAPYRHVVHAWVVDPEGRAFDAGGWFDRATLPDDFLANPRPGFVGATLVPLDGAGALRDLLAAAFNECDSRFVRAEFGDDASEDSWAEQRMDAWLEREAAEADAAIDGYFAPRWLSAPAAAPRM